MTRNRGLVTLIEQAGPPISRAPRRLQDTPVTLSRDRKIELEALLHLRDGFRTLAGVLLVRPSVSVASVRGIEEWNQLSLWRMPYVRAREVLFFAEDVFGRQFGLHKDEIVRFDPETGDLEHLSFTLERWAEMVVADPDALGGDALTAWLAEHPPLGVNDRLQPNVPRILQTDDTRVEYRVVEDLELMHLYARLYKERSPGTAPDLSWWWPTPEDDPLP